jgi:hypothetical protein
MKFSLWRASGLSTCHAALSRFINTAIVPFRKTTASAEGVIANRLLRVMLPKYHIAEMFVICSRICKIGSLYDQETRLRCLGRCG